MSKYLIEDTSLTAVADAIREKAEIEDSLVFPDGFMDAINGIEASAVITFTPAQTGVISIPCDVPETVTAILWCRTDVIPGSPPTNKSEGFMGMTVINKYTNNGSQNTFTAYYNSTSTTEVSASLYYSNIALHSLIASMASLYGGCLCKWNDRKRAVDTLSFYANDTEAKGLRVGATYTVYII